PRLTSEPFRWDQRVFSIVLKFPSIVVPPNSADEEQKPNPIAPISEVTGGESREIKNMKALLQYVEELATHKMHPGAVVCFDVLTQVQQTAQGQVHQQVLENPQ